LGGPQSQSGQLGDEKIFDPTGTQTLTPQSSSLLPVLSQEKEIIINKDQQVPFLFHY
jgi:hypothetical protein